MADTSKSNTNQHLPGVKMNFLFRPVHPASLAVTRILFGFLMLFDIPDERGGAEIDIRWGEPRSCHFPLFAFTPRPSYAWMCILYGIMWLGALGICLGCKFRFSCMAYLLPYWYILLLDKSFWNNHSYLYGLLAIMLSRTMAGRYWSIDSIASKQNRVENVPNWNYIILKFQIFCLYFFSGLKKLDMEWLEGYSMRNMGKHWAFGYFGFLLSTEQIDYFVIHLSGFLLDLTVGFFFIIDKTRPFAFFFCGMFNLINSRLFSIGMFPYVCIATMPLFASPDWPIRVLTAILNTTRKQQTCFNFQITGKQTTLKNCKTDNKTENGTISISKQTQQRNTMTLIISYCVLQLFLPWSHFITRGYNNWTNGLYGYSWDMMVHSWDTTLVIVRIVDNENGNELFLDPSAWTHNDRWNKHADMAVQYAECVQRNLQADRIEQLHHHVETSEVLSKNLSIYVDVWCSLNGRFQQRMFHPHYDLLRAKWSPFTDVEWLLPLLIEYSGFREKMKQIQEEVYSWSNYSDVLFVADFPGLHLENFITKDLVNISLVVIEGVVYYESEDNSQGLALKKGETVSITSNVFHKIKTVGTTPSCFMYTYVNSTKAAHGEVHSDQFSTSRSPFPILEDGQETLEGLATMFGLIGNALLHIVYDVPIVRRARVA